MKLNIQLFADGKVVIGIDLDTKGFDLEIDATKEKLNKLINEYKLLESAEPFEGQEDGLRELQEQIEKTRNKYVDLREKQDEFNNADTSKIGNGLNSITKNITKMGLGIIGVSSLFRLARKATSAYLGQNEATAQKMTAIWTALGNLLGPIIEKIATWLMKLIGYINVFVKAISGGKLDITKNMNKNTKATMGTAKAMKEVNKQLAGFDEMNVLGKDTAASADTGLGGGGAFNVEIPELNEKWVKWLEKSAYWLKENWDWIKKVGIALGTVFVASKIAGWIASIGSLIGFGGAAATGVGGVGLAGLATGFMAVAAAASVVAAIIQGFKVSKGIKQLKNEVDNQLKLGPRAIEVWNEIKDEVSETGMESERAATIFDILNGKINRNSDTIQKDIKQINNMSGATKFLDGVVDKLAGGPYSTLSQSKQNITDQKKAFEEDVAIIKAMYDAGNLTEEQQKQWIETMKINIDQLETLRLTTKKGSDEYNILSSMIKTAKQSIIDFGGQLDKGAASLEKTKNALKEVKEKAAEYAKQKIPFKTFGFELAFETKSANSSLSKFASNITSKLQSALNSVSVKNMARNIVNLLSKIPGFNTSSIKKAFGLAKGGIVSLPGRGVPVGGAVAGETGRMEGVLPLTDAQVMSMLGKEIGKNVIINASITNTMNGRVISKELQKINAENDFAYNR